MSRWALVLGALLGSACRPDAGERVATSTAPPLAARPLPSAAPSARAPADSPGIYYTFRAAEDLATMHVDVCFEGPRPERLEPPMAGARAYLERMTAKGHEVPCGDDGVRLDELGDCVGYDVDTAAVIRDGSSHDGTALVGDDALLSPDFWVWCPTPRSVDLPLYARFVGPVEAAVPWPREAHGEYTHRIPESLFAWKSQAAVGTLGHTPVDVGGAVIDAVILGEGFGERREAVLGWLERSARAGGALLGRFPVARSQVLLVPDGDRRESFGYAMRGGGPSATVLLASRPTDEALAADWTAVHELLHFALPSMPTSEAWFYEGIVTYLTALARARAGMTSERYGWWELLDGFERGTAAGTGRTLREESRDMDETRAYWRVYWAGAAVALMIDVDLRRRGKSLPALVSELAATNLDAARSFTGEEIYARIDELAGGGSARAAAARWLDGAAFPDTTELRARLGVTLAKRHDALIDPRAPDAAITRAIMVP
jgi:hypothetical protein